jgi:hypothetical protein
MNGFATDVVLASSVEALRGGLAIGSDMARRDTAESTS